MATTAFSPKQPTPNENPDPTLTPTQQQVIALLAAGVSTRAITEEVKIHRNTIGNWRRTNPAFAHALAQAQYDRTLAFRDGVEDLAQLALHTIGDILHDRDAPASVRLRAALAILQQATTLPPPPPAEPADPAQQSGAESEPPQKITVLQTDAAPPENLHNVHNSAQSPNPAPGAPRPTPSPSRRTAPQSAIMKTKA